MEQEPQDHDEVGIVMQPPAVAPWVTTAPPGVRFVPTESELVHLYLTNRFLKFPVPPNIIRELNVYAYHPDELQGLAHNTRSGQVLYFFTPLKLLGGGKVNFDRTARNGSWVGSRTYRGLYKTSAFVPRENAADPVIALCIIHPTRAADYLPALENPRNVRPVREDNEQPVGADEADAGNA